MAPPIPCCTICGWFIYDDEGIVSWMNQFRGVCTGAESEGIVLTGVGLYNDPRRSAFFAPTDPAARWDDPGYTNPEEHEVESLSPYEQNDRRGSVFHDACWSLLERAFHPAPAPLVRLFNVCNSLDFVLARGMLDWGHDYRGLAILDTESFFPWEQRLAQRAFPDGWSDVPYSADPLIIPEIDQILTEPPSEVPPFGSFSGAVLSGNDPFESLPDELCSAVAFHLPTRDVLNARRASRSFWHVFYSQQFWASRFDVSSERSWLFESRNTSYKAKVRDWRWLYHRTMDCRIGRALKNRKRIWGLIQDVAVLTELSWAEPELPPSPPLQDHTSWLLAAGSLPDKDLKDFSQLERGCSRRKSQQVALPDAISQVSTSSVPVGDAEYITGISLTTVAGEVIRLGYRGGKERSVSISGGLLGFNVAVGSRGIHALQCIGGGTEGAPSVAAAPAWLGCPDDAPKTERLVVGTPITALDVGFDGFKMVSIAVPGRHDDSKAGLLRSSAIWYPDVPPAALDLNEEVFVPIRNHTWGFRPLFWTCFGGPDGIYLPHLTKIAVLDWAGLGRIDFFFDREVPTECRSFGRRKDNDTEKLIELSIDGPGGEVIEAVEIRQEFPLKDENWEYVPEWLRQEGKLIRLQIRTNRQRTLEISRRSNRSKSRSIVKKKFLAAPGTAITGFYGTQNFILGCPITGLGVMTATLSRKSFEEGTG
ncbi:hypothetical protein QBC43DRAFT_376620 [Cladorrhinum sp. PSN259]|nr:hypothetical protein QBC43DRAFT_376620 [Cladorrhinum sp. PSN259]